MSTKTTKTFHVKSIQEKYALLDFFAEAQGISVEIWSTTPAVTNGKTVAAKGSVPGVTKRRRRVRNKAGKLVDRKIIAQAQSLSA